MVLIAQPGAVVAFMLVGSSDGLVATISQYLLAPLTDDQLKVGDVETPVAPLPGAVRLGAARVVVVVVGVWVVKLLWDE